MTNGFSISNQALAGYLRTAAERLAEAPALMPEAEYERRVLARNSGLFHTELLNPALLASLLADLVAVGQKLDSAKKALVYGDKDHARAIWQPGFEAAQWPVVNSRQAQLVHALLGLITEASEMAEQLIAFTESGSFDLVNVAEELGDANWYRVLGLNAIGETEDGNRFQNDNKLERRFGAAYDSARVQEGARDRDAERRGLEQDMNGGQNLIESARVHDASITNAKIGDPIRSAGFGASSDSDPTAG